MPKLTAAQTRLALLTAGRALAERKSAAALTPRSIGAAAKIGVAQFRKHFASRQAYLCELMELMLDEVREAITKLTYNMPPGLPRMKLAIETYLAANLHRPTLRQLMTELRADPAGTELVRRRIGGFTMMLELELKSLRWPRPAAVARLLTAAIVETAQTEHEARRLQPHMRETLYLYLDSRA